MVKELEVKVLNIDLNEIEKRIISLGGKMIAKELQVNTLIDSNNKPIKSYLDAYLRIRETKDILNDIESTTLTLKKNIKNNNLRENIELNTEVSDKETMLQILKDLGFDNIEIGHKERTSYELKGARIDLDIWDKKTYPYPYMEIEVENQDDLNYIIGLLEIPQENVSKKSIVELRKELVME
jgi:adenylate cyclase class 2